MPTHHAVPIATTNAPRPNGHYSQAVSWGDLVFTAIQLPAAANGSAETASDLEGQVRQLFANLSAILDAAGSSLAQALKVTLYVTDLAAWAEVDRVYAEIMGDHRPARGVVAVKELRYGCLIAADVIAVRSTNDG